MDTAGIGKSILNALMTAIAGRVLGILRTELEDAKLEVKTKAKGLGVGVALVAVAFGLLGVATVMLIISGTIALAEVWPAWLATLVIGGGLLLIAILLASIGAYKVNKNKNLKPERAIANLQRYFGR